MNSDLDVAATELDTTYFCFSV